MTINNIQIDIPLYNCFRVVLSTSNYRLGHLVPVGNPRDRYKRYLLKKQAKENEKFLLLPSRKKGKIDGIVEPAQYLFT